MSGLEPIILAAALAGTAVEAAGQVQGGRQQKAMSDWEADQNDRRATQEQAAAQRKSLDRRRQTDALLSDQQAAFAASGADVAGSAYDVMGATAQKGDLNARTELFEGDEKARALGDDAEMKRVAGRAAMRASKMQATATVLKGIGSAYTGWSKGQSGGSAGSGGRSYAYGGGSGSGTSGWSTSVTYG